MRGADVKIAVHDTDRNDRDVCRALDIVLPVLRRLAEGRRWWLAWGMRTLVAALDEYREAVCR